MLCQSAVNYQNFVAAAAAKLPAFQRFHSFLQTGSANYGDRDKSKGTAKISYIAFGENRLPTKPVEISEESLEECLAEGEDCKLYIVENISPTIASLLGGGWDIDPQFFME